MRHRNNHFARLNASDDDKLNTKEILPQFLKIFVSLLVLLVVLFLYINSKDNKSHLAFVAQTEYRSVDLAVFAISDLLQQSMADALLLSSHHDVVQLLDGAVFDGGKWEYQSEHLAALESQMQDICQRREVYDQIRIIDDDGNEVVRINYVDGEPYSVPAEELQNKKRRYYFEDTMKLDYGEIFVSPMDLNIEHDEIEQPLKPMIRIGTPIKDSLGRRRGVIILNYLSQRLLDVLAKGERSAFGHILLVNREGYWLKGMDPAQEWGFMFPDRAEFTISNASPDAWSRLISEEADQLVILDGMFTFSTIHPVYQGTYSSSGSGMAFASSTESLEADDYYWKLVSFIPRDELTEMTMSQTWQKLGLFAALIPLLLITSWIVASARTTSRKAHQLAVQHLALLNSALESLTYPFIIIDTFTREILMANSAAKVGNLSEGVKCYAASHMKDAACCREIDSCPLITMLETGEPVVFEYTYDSEPNEPKDKEVHCYPIRGEDGRITMAIEYSIDITERRKTERRLQQAEKMETIGQLAGGIAHDFNNILFAIRGFSELTRDQLRSENLGTDDIDQVLIASDRAADLVKQILTFCRKHEQNKVNVRVAILIKEALKLVRAALPVTIEIESQITSPDALVEADPTVLHQIIMNLCTNAGHSMFEHGGKLLVSLEQVSLTNYGSLPDVELPDGNYIQIRVSDTGTGIAPEILDKLFEPFFTTKDVGIGTGLGLAIVKGAVDDLRGIVKVYSEVGIGSTFSVYLPEVSGEAAKIEPIPHESLTGSERILLVDDEEHLVSLLDKKLSSLGYQVSGFTSSEEALELVIENPESIDAVISDCTMPRLTGPELAKRIETINPQIPVLLCTGFGQLLLQSCNESTNIAGVMIKPVRLDELVLALRRTLDGSGSMADNVQDEPITDSAE